MIELVLRKPTEEVLTIEKLKQLFETKRRLRHYIGFEISGFVHLGNGLVCMEKVRDFQKAEIGTNIFLADLHSWINKKLGGDLETIREVAGKYFKKALQLSLKCVGGDPEEVNFILGSKLYEKLGLEYLENVLKVSMKTTLSRIKRSITILGRKQGESISFAQLIYVPMQVADAFSIKVDIAHGGMDQRKAHVIALEVEKEFNHKMVAVHHGLLMGIHIDQKTWELLVKAKKEQNRELLENVIIDIKMSKSKPKTAIFIHDSEEEIRKKVFKAFCPPRIAEFNPVFSIIDLVILPTAGKLEIKGREFSSFEEIKREYEKGNIHPADLKEAVAESLIEILEPARKFFENEGQRIIEELKEIKTTR